MMKTKLATLIFLCPFLFLGGTSNYEITEFPTEQTAPIEVEQTVPLPESIEKFSKEMNDLTNYLKHEKA